MQSFTFGSDEAMAAVVAAQETEVDQYSMTLNASDFRSVLYALREYGDGVGEFAQEDDEQRENAHSILSGIAQTLGIEFV